ncbi:MAG: DUF748 domain-containing protein [Deltaproteobacteria bacterium]|nr:DUF748 domain-containing protein [Deltaproteobacteria bacterium]
MLRSILIRGSSKLLHTRVELGDVDISLLRAGICLENLAIDDPADLTKNGVEHPAVLIGWKRLAVELRWLPLLKHIVQLRDIDIDSPHIALERLKNGALNVSTLVPSSAPAEPATTPAEPVDHPWRVAIDHVGLRSGALRFQDHLVEGAEPVEVGLDQIEVSDIALQPGVYGEPSHIHVDIKVDDAVIGVEARFELRDPGLFLEAAAKAESFPLHRARVYIPNVGWSDLRGVLNTELVYRLETGVHDEVRGKLSLEDVTIRSATFDRPALAWKRFEVGINSCDILHRNVDIANVSLSGADILVRPDSDALLPAFATAPDAGSAAAPPAAETPPTPVPSPAAEAPWQWSIASLHLDDSRVHLISDPALDIVLAADTQDLTSAGDQAVPLNFTVTVGEGSLNIDGQLRLKPIGLAAQLKIAQLDVPSELAALHVGPTGLIAAAKLDTNLNIAFGSLAPAAGDLNARGNLTVSDLQVVPPGTAHNRIAAERLHLDLDELNLSAVLDDTDRPRNLSVRGKIDLADGQLSSGEPVASTAGLKSLQVGFAPLQVAGLGGKAAATGDLEWHGSISLTDVKLAPNLVSGFESTLSSLELAADPLQIAALLTATSRTPLPADGDVHWRGSLAVRAPHFTSGGQGGSADAGNIGLSGVDVKLEGAAARNPLSAGDIAALGTLSISDIRLLAGDPKAFSASIKSIDLPLEDLRLPKILSAAGTSDQATVRLGAIRIGAPNVRLTRTADGIILPSFAGSASGEHVVPPGKQTPSRSSPPPNVSIKSFALKQGSIVFDDRTTKPYFGTAISPLNIEATSLRFPNPRVASLRVDSGLKPDGTLRVSGSLDDSGGKLDLTASDIGLLSFNPYVTAYSSYSIDSGSLSAVTKASSSGPSYKADTALTLHDFDVSGSEGDSLFQKQFGIPLTVALALLRDLSGNIVLNIPVETSDQGTKINLLSVIGDGLRAAIVGALASPLKLVGAVLQGNKVAAVAPPELKLRAGRTDLTPEGSQQLDQLAALLASRPGMAVTLETTASNQDTRWLREHALLEELSQPQGLFGTLKHIGRNSAREAIRKALQARAEDGQGELDPEQQQTLERWLDEHPPVSAGQLQKLSADRLAQIRDRLSEQHGVDKERVDIVEPTPATTDEAPILRTKLHPVGKPAAAIAPQPPTQPEPNGAPVHSD